MRAKIIAIANQKGGTGKTTTCISLGTGLSAAGKKVLIVDLDSQGNLTMCLGYDPDELSVTIVGALQDIVDRETHYQNREYILPGGEMDLIPADMNLFYLESRLSSGQVFKREYTLQRLLDTLRPDYDYILIDCAPALNTLLINALVAADEVLIPMQAKFLSTKGREMLFKIIREVQDELKADLKVNGMLFTMVDTRAKRPRELMAETRAQCGSTYIYETYIPMSVKVDEGQANQTSIMAYRDNKVGKSYQAFVNELLNREG